MAEAIGVLMLLAGVSVGLGYIIAIFPRLWQQIVAFVVTFMSEWYVIAKLVYIMHWASNWML